MVKGGRDGAGIVDGKHWWSRSGHTGTDEREFLKEEPADFDNCWLHSCLCGKWVRFRRRVKVETYTSLDGKMTLLCIET